MIRSSRLFVPLLPLFLALGLSAQAKVVYVDKNAAGAVHDGTSWSAACLTVTAGVAAATTSGDEVWVAKGVYIENGITPKAGVALYGGFAGTETQRGQRNIGANATVLDGGNSATNTVVVCNFQNVIVDGFTIRNGRGGVYVSDATATLANNTISGNNGNGVSVSGGTATLANNTVSGNFYSGVHVRVGSTAILASNTVSGNGSHGVYVDFGGTATLANNTVLGNYHGVYVSDGMATLANNTVSGNNVDGVYVYSGWATLANNIVAFNGGHGVHRDSRGTISSFRHNDVYGNAERAYIDYTPPAGQGNFSVDPLFVDRTGRDFRLQAGSPGIDTGDDTAVAPGSTDRDGKPRIIGGHVDMGAYEFGSVAAAFGRADVQTALGIAVGMLSASGEHVSRLNVETANPALDIRDAARLARKAAGLDANP